MPTVPATETLAQLQLDEGCASECRGDRRQELQVSAAQRDATRQNGNRLGGGGACDSALLIRCLIGLRQCPFKVTQ